MAPSEPRATVIVRTRNRPAMLAEALGSLREQSFRNFEVVVVNDGGDAPSIPADLGVPCTVVGTEEPRGRARALNTGVRAARGHYVAYLDDDDLYLPGHLETLIRFLDGSDQYQAVYSDVEIVELTLGDDGHYVETARRSGFGRDFVPGRIQFSNFIPLISLAHRRSLFDVVGPFDETFDLFEDWEFMIRLAAATRPHRLRHVTSLYRVRDDGTNAVTATAWGGPVAQAARRRIYEKHWALHTPETEMAAFDMLERDLTTLLPWQARAIEAETLAAQQRETIARLGSDVLALRNDSARAAQLGYERESKLHDEVASLRAQLATERQEREQLVAKLEEQVAHVTRDRDDLSAKLRQAYDAGTALQQRLDAMEASLGWRMLSPWRRFKAWIGR
ncbi:MAG: glycosyltransferase [Acidobacteria bacterium]|nr:glycosyltransferase [Acidobacteriota bacterium]